MAAGRYSTVPCSEDFGARRERIGKNGRWQIDTILECDWALRWDLIGDLYTSLTSSTGPFDPETTPFPYLPRAFPDPPAVQGSNDTRIGFSSVTSLTYSKTKYTTEGDGQVIGPAVARVGVQYTRYWDIEDSLEWNTKFLRMNPINLQWAGGVAFGDDPQEAFTGDDRQLKPEEAPAILLREAILTRHFIGLSQEFVNTLPDFIGYTNAGSYQSSQLGTTFQPGTLLLLKPRVTHGINLYQWRTSNQPFGSGFEVTLRFLYKPTGHNFFWRPNVKSPIDGTTIADPTQNPANMYGFWDRMLVKLGEDPPGDFWPFPTNENMDKLWLRSPNGQRLPTFAT